MGETGVPGENHRLSPKSLATCSHGPDGIRTRAVATATGIVRATLTVVSAVVYYMLSIGLITVRDPSIYKK